LKHFAFATAVIQILPCRTLLTLNMHDASWHAASSAHMKTDMKKYAGLLSWLFVQKQASQLVCARNFEGWCIDITTSAGIDKQGVSCRNTAW